eukprot:2849650-Amphidinium_carterae.1
MNSIPRYHNPNGFGRVWIRDHVKWSVMIVRPADLAGEDGRFMQSTADNGWGINFAFVLHKTQAKKA